jgi:hypothetical protein
MADAKGAAPLGTPTSSKRLVLVGSTRSDCCAARLRKLSCVRTLNSVAIGINRVKGRMGI